MGVLVKNVLLSYLNIKPEIEFGIWSKHNNDYRVPDFSSVEKVGMKGNSEGQVLAAIPSSLRILSNPMSTPHNCLSRMR